MTVRQMVDEFQHLLETTTELFQTTDRMSTQEVLDFMNYAQRRYMKSRYLPNDNMFEDVAAINLRLNELRNLIKSDVDLNITDVVDEQGVYWAMFGSDDYFAYLSSSSKITRDSNPEETTERLVPNKLVTFHALQKNLTTPFNAPIIREPLVSLYRLDQTNGVAMYILIDRYTTLEGAKLNYIRFPKELTLGILDEESELDKSLHQQFVEHAVSMYLDEYKLKLAQRQQ